MRWGSRRREKTRESLKFSPVLEMRQGLWSDDTSLTLCTLASLRENDWRLDYHDLLRRFAKWLEYGYLTPESMAFDIGATTKQALLNYLNGVPLSAAHRVTNGTVVMVR